MDEIAVTGSTSACEVRDGRTTLLELTPEALGLKRWTKAELAGDDAKQNARIIRDVLAGQKGAPRDAVLANAAAAIYVVGLAPSVEEGVKRAATAVDSGAAKATLERLVRASRGEAA